MCSLLLLLKCLKHGLVFTIAKRRRMNEWVWNIGAMTLAGKRRSARRKTCPNATSSTINPIRTVPRSKLQQVSLKARLHGSPRLINAVESTKVNRVNSSFQRKWSTGLTGEQVGDGQLSSFNVVDSLWVTHNRLPVCVLFLYVWFYFW